MNKERQEKKMLKIVCVKLVFEELVVQRGLVFPADYNRNTQILQVGLSVFAALQVAECNFLFPRKMR